MTFSQFLIPLHLWHTQRWDRQLPFPTYSHRQFTCHQIQTSSFSLSKILAWHKEAGLTTSLNCQLLEFLFFFLQKKKYIYMLFYQDTECLNVLPSEGYSHLLITNQNTKSSLLGGGRGAEDWARHQQPLMMREPPWDKKEQVSILGQGSVWHQPDELLKSTSIWKNTSLLQQKRVQGKSHHVNTPGFGVTLSRCNFNGHSQRRVLTCTQTFGFAHPGWDHVIFLLVFGNQRERQGLQ